MRTAPLACEAPPGNAQRSTGVAITTVAMMTARHGDASMLDDGARGRTARDRATQVNVDEGPRESRREEPGDDALDAIDPRDVLGLEELRRRIPRTDSSPPIANFRGNFTRSDVPPRANAAASETRP